MTQINDLCDQIVKQLTKLGLQTERNMLPGISEEKIREAAVGLPFVLPRSVIDLYQWSEGLRPRAGVGNDFFPGYGMESLPEMIEIYRELSTAPDFPRFRVDDRHWFPLFRSGGTDFYGVCCTNAPTADGEVVNDDNDGEHRVGMMLPVVEFVSLEAMLSTLLRCYESGVYYVDQKGRLEVGMKIYFDDGPRKGRLKDIDLSGFKEVARQFNPGLKCWQ